MIEHKNDVVVVGGGPSGSAAAIALARWGYSVAVIERSNYDDMRVGETLPPSIRPQLEQLGFWQTFLNQNHLTSYSTRSAWGSEDLFDHDYIFNPYGVGWHIDRVQFDASLATSAREAGAELHHQTTVTSCDPTSEKDWSIKVTSNGGRTTFRARFLVDATGRASILSRKLGVQKVQSDQLVGISAMFIANQDEATLEPFTLIEAEEKGWWYLAPLPNGKLIVSYLTDLDLYKQGRQQSSQFWFDRLCETQHIHPSLSQYNLISQPKIFLAHSHLVTRLPSQHFLPIGDAVMSLDPLSGQGVSYALQTGFQAAQAISKFFQGDRTATWGYLENVQSSFIAYMNERKHHYAEERRWQEADFWLRRC